jgi:alpha-L-rhamnosidase/Glycosyl hydrolase 2 galactose-binding domain-like
MSAMTRRDFLGITATGVGGLWLGNAWPIPAHSASPAGSLAALFKAFTDPDRKYSIRPFWFWNGKMEAEEISRQIRLMVGHGVYGAYAHNRDGLQTPYLSEDWWQAVGAGLKAARENGFAFCLVDEFEWPSGEARDYWMPGINKSRVVAANPDFHIRVLRPTETVVAGPQRAEIPLPSQTHLVVAGKRLSPGRLDGDTLRTLPVPVNASTLTWDAPDGEWLVVTYQLRPSKTPDGGTVDLMSAEAVRKYIEIYYEEFHRRYSEYFGNTFPATFADHEGSYGGTIAWTPRLFESFRAKAGYDLQPLIPALVHDIGEKTEKVRCDYLDTISDLYSTNFFQQVHDWCHAHGLQHSGHVWEESMFFGPWVQGDFYRILRSIGQPGCDTLVEWARQSVWLREVASVADFEGRHVVCENQGVQGGDSYLSPERMRRVSNCLGAWNVGEFIPHAFDYDLGRINFPPDWFLSQPFLSHFRSYADQMRRISFMNRESQHVADLLLFYPQVSIWGQSSPAFRTEGSSSVTDAATWSHDAAETNSSYAQLKLRLTDENLDFKVADDAYLAGGYVAGKTFAIAASRFATLVLPPMSTVRRRTAERVSEFYAAGGTVIAIGRLPFISVQEGRDDPQLKSQWDAMFDTSPTDQPFTLRTNASGGRAYFVSGSVDDAVALLAKILERDFTIVSGPRGHLYFLHKKKEGTDFYWVVNDSAAPRTNLLRLRCTGKAERWDAVTGQRSPVFYQTDSSSTLVRLALGPWDAAYIVLDSAGPAQPLELRSTNLDEFCLQPTVAGEVKVQGRALVSKDPVFVELSDGQLRYRGEYRPAPVAPLEISGDWQVTVEAPAIPIPYAQVKDDPQDQGLGARWFQTSSTPAPWDQVWLSPMNCSLRQWNALGPFPNLDDNGLEQVYPPEKEIDYRATYTGEGGRHLRWATTNSARQAIEGESGWNWPLIHISGGPYAPSSNIVNYVTAVKGGAPPSGTFYAQTNLYAPEAQEAVVILATGNPCAAWMNARQVYSRWLRPLYFDLADGFACRIPVELQPGWNNLLLKFLHNPESERSGEFTCRVEPRNGGSVAGLVSSPRQMAGGRPQPARGFRWLRIPVPAVAAALRVPTLAHPWMVWIDTQPASASAETPLPKGTRFVTLRVAADEILRQPFEFRTAPASLPLGTWTVPGLEHFSGHMTYEKTLDVPASLLAERVLLDCGQVGVVADAWVNGQPVGARPWEPFVFEVTRHLHPGRNQLKVRVANTEANARAVGTSSDILKNIDLNGWLGPVHLVPYIDRTIVCHRV